jgi:hypothetical protein
MVFNTLNFENGLGWFSLSAYWQSVIRGLFLLAMTGPAGETCRQQHGEVKHA